MLISGLVFAVAASVVALRLRGRYTLAKDNPRATLVLQGLVGSTLVASAGFLPVNVTVAWGDSSSVVWLFPWNVHSDAVWITCFLGVAALAAWFQYDKAPEVIRGATAAGAVLAYGTSLFSTDAGVHTLRVELSGREWIESLFAQHDASHLHVYSCPVSVLPVTFGASWLVMGGWKIAYEHLRQYILRTPT